MEQTQGIGRAVALSCGLLALVAALLITLALVAGGTYLLLGG
jgi:hypothetical protein